MILQNFQKNNSQLIKITHVIFQMRQGGNDAVYVQ